MKFFIKLLIIPTTLFCHSLVAQANIIEFSNTEKDGFVMQVTKTDSERVFSICKKNLETSDLENCTEVNRFAVRIIEGTDAYMPGGFFEALPETVGTTGGALVGLAGGIFASLVFSDGTAVAPQSTLRGNIRGGVAFFVVLGLVSGAGYMLGDWIDGEEFSKVEAAAIRATIVNEDILDPLSDTELSIDTDLNTYRTYLGIAIEAVSSEN